MDSKSQDQTVGCRYISWLGEAKFAYCPGHQVFPVPMILLLEKGGLAREDYLGTLRSRRVNRVIVA